MTTVINNVINSGLTYLSRNRLVDIFETVQQLESDSKHPRDAVCIEAGCALGGSSIVITSAKDKQRKLLVYDVFGMIPQPSDEDDIDVQQRYHKIVAGESEGINGNTYYGYIPNLQDVVLQNFSRQGFPILENNVHLIQGRFQETIFLSEKVLFAHIDCDWYDSVKVCLERITPCLVKGGIIAIDDYDFWSGCKKAVDEFLTLHVGEFNISHRDQFFLEKK